MPAGNRHNNESATALSAAVSGGRFHPTNWNQVKAAEKCGYPLHSLGGVTVNAGPVHANSSRTIIPAIWDTGAMRTSTHNAKFLHAIRKLTDKALYVEGVNGVRSRVELEGLFDAFSVPNVAKVPRLPAILIPKSNCLLISISQACALLGAHTFFGDKMAYMWDDTRVIATAKMENGLYLQQPHDPSFDVGALHQAILATLPRGKPMAPPVLNVAMNSNISTHDSLRRIHDSANHLAFSTIRTLFGLPPASDLGATDHTRVKGPKTTKTLNGMKLAHGILR